MFYRGKEELGIHVTQSCKAARQEAMADWLKRKTALLIRDPGLIMQCKL